MSTCLPHLANPLKDAACSTLWQRLQAWQVRTLAVVGMTKNTGKTVCLNHLLQQARLAHVPVGLTSIGRDGEARDQVFQFAKPPVCVTAGSLIATARGTLPRSKVRARAIDGTGIDSPMGEILVVKALDDGEMEVAGASRSCDQQQVLARLRQCGADVVLLDGALGRSHHASPAMADAVVLATGAAIGGGMDDVLRKTRDRLAILGIQQVDDATHARVSPLFEQGGIAAWQAHGACVFKEAIPTLNAAEVMRAWRHDDLAMVAVTGAVGRQLWRAVHDLLRVHPGLTLVVGDGTRLFIDASDVKAFEQAGGRLLALQGIHLLGITLNPFSPFGGSFDPERFLAHARRAWPHHLVTDVMLQQAAMGLPQPVPPATPAMPPAPDHHTVSTSHKEAP
ncbi:MAG: hypothetical protein QM742_12020 [Aquabacterium sp.]